MNTLIKILTEEIEFYQSQNCRLYLEDLLRKIEEAKEIHQKQIAENNARIESLLEAITQDGL